MDFDTDALRTLEHSTDLLEGGRLERIQHDPLQQAVGLLNHAASRFVARGRIGLAARQERFQRRYDGKLNVRGLGPGDYRGRIGAHEPLLERMYLGLDVSAKMAMHVDR